MKTTNFEVSKKLKEAGFEAKTSYGWNIDNMEIGVAYPLSNYAFEKEFIKSYDLETLLDALPEWIHDKKNCSSKESLELTKHYIEYSSTLSYDYHRVNRQENESLADTAGRLWLLLKEKGLV